MPSQLLVSYVDPTQKKLLLQMPTGILLPNDNIIAVIIPGKENEATFGLNERGEILRHTVTPTTGAIGRKASLIADHFGLSDTGAQFVITGCNDSCVCSLVCGSIPVWYCPLIGFVSTPIGGILCSIVFLITCSRICQ